MQALLPRFARHTADLWRLAWPVMLSRAGILLMAFVDIAMLGRYAPGAIGIANLGVQIFVPLLVVSIGLASGVMPIVAMPMGPGSTRSAVARGGGGSFGPLWSASLGL